MTGNLDCQLLLRRVLWPSPLQGCMDHVPTLGHIVRSDDDFDYHGGGYLELQGEVCCAVLNGSWPLPLPPGQSWMVLTLECLLLY